MLHILEDFSFIADTAAYSPHGLGKLLAAALGGAVRDEPGGAQLRPVVAQVASPVGQVAVALAELADVPFQLLPRRMRLNLSITNFYGTHRSCRIGLLFLIL